MKSYIEAIRANRNLTFQEMEGVAGLLFDERTDEKKIASFLKSLAQKGETADEVAALASVMSSHAIRPEFPEGSYIDNCGTGGDGSNSFNISTASAFVMAASGVCVAKHGNRKISSAAGSHDVLEELGMRNDLTLSETTAMMEQTGIAFLFAPNVHPKMKRIGEIRRRIGSPTIFNLVGPLTNPVPLYSQYTGINRKEFVMEYASVLNMLGRKRAVVVAGAGGLDEATLAGRNTLVLADRGDLIPFTLTAEDVGLEPANVEAIRGGDAAHNATIIRSIMDGQRGPQFDTVVFNAGIGLFTEGIVRTVQEGVRLAEDSILAGRAKRKLEEVAAFCEQCSNKVVTS
ncbi:anthranilate phosphoribosyltransferase [Sporosarcina sp. BI001-red]|uniref:anthranilate phosphoribosyltransferase n=1 Tax=Sporosarcina sp. BI001-red TaxID=2282866 RepID=UPI000E2323FA|nr:anthranilate phosphoribosyltransferase [Sporosarcina sp. BI001-red]REB07991.1 anthranilate phosphoribosyltransferase [Sporosarcina sp. BI001-red]